MSFLITLMTINPMYMSIIILFDCYFMFLKFGDFYEKSCNYSL